MAYEKQEWTCGEVVTAEKLNHMEDGIKSASEKNDATDALETQVDLLEARVDNIIAPSGTAPNPDEIIDARVGADGTQYDSLGNAIRGQVTDLKSDLGYVATSSLCVDFTLEQGAASATADNTYEQNKVANATRVRTDSLLKLDATKKYIVFADFKKYRISVSKYNDEGKCTDGTTWMYDKIIVTNTPYIAIAVKYPDDTNITPSDVTRLCVVEEKAIFNLNNSVEAIKDATTIADTQEVPLSFSSTTGFYNKNGGFDTFDGITAAIVSVTNGEVYYYTGQNFYNAVPIAFLDSSDNFVSSFWKANNTAPLQNEKIVVPSGATKMLVQRAYDYSPIKVGKAIGIKAKTIQSILLGKKITVIGDSITEKNFRAKTNWVLWLTDWCGATFQNLGRSGTGFRAGYNQSKNYYPRIASVQATPDIIGVAVSFNDISNPDVALGTITDTTANDTVAGYANDFFDALITAYPTTPIICYVQNPWWAFHYGVARSDAWIELMAEICAIRGIPFYSDLYKGCTLKPWLLASREEYFTSDDTDGGSSGVVDDTHPNSEGHKVIARYLYPRFAENVVDVGLDYSN